MKCSRCGSQFEAVERERTLEFRGRSVTVPARYLQCEGCGELLVDPRDSTAASQRAADEVRRREGLLPSAEIVAVRNKLGLTQREFERLLRVGKNTVVRWEAGTVIQNPAIDATIRGVRDVPEFAVFLANLHGVKLKNHVDFEANAIAALSFGSGGAGPDLWTEIVTEQTEKTVETRRIFSVRTGPSRLTLHGFSGHNLA